MLKVKDNVDLKELEKYGWELDTLNCLNTCQCNDCNCKNNCPIYQDQMYYKNISEYLQYTNIYVSNLNKEIYGVFDEYKNIYSNNEDYKYIKEACQEEIKVGIIEEVED